MNLYQITNEYLILASQLEQGELTPEIEEQLQINEAQIKEKGINYGFVIKSIENEIYLIESEIKRLQEIKKIKNNAVDRLKNAITEAMQLYGFDKIESHNLKLSFRKSESVEIINENQIEDKFKKQSFTIDKTSIKNAIKNGENVEGAIVEVNYNLQIK